MDLQKYLKKYELNTRLMTSLKDDRLEIIGFIDRSIKQHIKSAVYLNSLLIMLINDNSESESEDIINSDISIEDVYNNDIDFK